VYIKHYHSLNKQFSIDSFLDWEGLLLGFRYASTPALVSLLLSQVPSPLLDARSTERANIISLVLKLREEFEATDRWMTWAKIFHSKNSNVSTHLLCLLVEERQSDMHFFTQDNLLLKFERFQMIFGLPIIRFLMHRSKYKPCQNGKMFIRLMTVCLMSFRQHDSPAMTVCLLFP